MNARRVGRLLFRVLPAAETSSTRAATQLVPGTKEFSSNSRSSSLYSQALAPWRQQQQHVFPPHELPRGCAGTPAAKPDEELNSEREEQAAENIAQALVKLEAEAMELAAAGEPERASEMLDEAFEMVANTENLGPSSAQAASIFMAHVSVLQRVGLFEKLIQVSADKLPYMQEVPESEMLRALCVLRLAAAYLGLGQLENAQEALKIVGTLLETQSEVDETAIPGFLVPEYQFYCVMMNLVIARSAEDVKALENHLLAAVSGISNAVPKELGADFPFLVCALQAHSKVLHRAIEGSAPTDITHALFSQCRMLQRAADCSSEDKSLIDYQYGTWVYAEGDDLQHARDLIHDSQQELQRAFNESRQGKESELAQNVNILEAADLEKSPDGDPTMQDVNWEHQAALRKFRTAVIDTIMVVTKAKVADSALSGSTQGTLSTMAAAYEDLLGADNAISGEARYCLSLWGIHEGLLEKGGSDSTTKYNMLKDNMLKCLLNMASSLHGGETHMLVQRLLDVADNLVEGMNLREELSNALAAEEASEEGHDHDHHHHHGSGGDCGHDHSHHHSHDHSHTEGHTHTNSSNDTLGSNSSDSGSKDTLVDAGTGSDAKR